MIIYLHPAYISIHLRFYAEPVSLYHTSHSSQPYLDRQHTTPLIPSTSTKPTWLMPTMDSHQENNLIDFSPPSSGISTPISRHSQSYSQSQPRSPPSTSSTSGSYIGSAVLGLWRRLSTLETPGSPPSGIANS